MGFTDAEGSFNINRLLGKDKKTSSNFAFMFKIALHKDDEMVLRYINNKLGIGGVRLYKDECIFNVTNPKGVALLIDIFDKYNLNTTKYLNFLALANGNNIYKTKKSNRTWRNYTYIKGP